MKRIVLSSALVAVAMFGRTVIASDIPTLVVSKPKLPDVHGTTTSSSAIFVGGTTLVRASYQVNRSLLLSEVVEKELESLRATGATEKSANWPGGNPNISAFTWTRTLPGPKPIVRQGWLVMKLYRHDGNAAIVTFYGSWPAGEAATSEQIFRTFISSTEIRF